MIGGGLAVERSPTIENCRFINNRTYYGGGAYFYQSESSVIDCVFHQNRADADGGGGQVFGGNVVFDGCTFTYNLAVNSHGGGAHVTQGSATFVDCSLSNNTANIGGGITFYATGGLVTLDGCEIDGNIAAIAGGFWVRPGFSDFLLIDTEICANAPTPFVGRYTDGGGNIFCSGCRGDLNSDGQVNSSDIGILLGFWGFPGVGIPVAADLNNDAVVDAADLSILLGNWGRASRRDRSSNAPTIAQRRGSVRGAFRLPAGIGTPITGSWRRRTHNIGRPRRRFGGASGRRRTT